MSAPASAPRPVPAWRKVVTAPLWLWNTVGGADLAGPHQAWRRRIFAASWLAYFGYYFCRRPYNIARDSLIEAHHWTDQTAANIWATYLFAYAVGQFMAGWAGDRFGTRRVLLTGMLVTMVTNAAFGMTDSVMAFTVLMGVNGVVQATGWSACVGTMGAWFRRRERATVMGPWSTNFQVGALLASPFASWSLGQGGYPWAFYTGSLVMAAVWVFFALNQRNRPEDVGLPSEEEDLPQGAPAAATAPAEESGLPRAMVLNIIVVGAFYFFAKLIRYAFWSWVPLLLHRQYGLSSENSGYLSSVFEFSGMSGTIVAGYLADRLFKGRLATLGFVFTAAMATSMAFLYLGGLASLGLFVVGIGLVGFFLFGPDALLTGAGAVNVGSPKKAALAAGLISGIGSVGPIVQELVLPRYISDGDVQATFGMLLISALLCLLSLGWMVHRNRSGKADL